MATKQDDFRVGPTVPSRPGKLMIAILIVIVVGFFVLLFSQTGTTVTP